MSPARAGLNRKALVPRCRAYSRGASRGVLMYHHASGIAGRSSEALAGRYLRAAVPRFLEEHATIAARLKGHGHRTEKLLAGGKKRPLLRARCRAHGRRCPPRGLRSSSTYPLFAEKYHMRVHFYVLSARLPTAPEQRLLGWTSSSTTCGTRAARGIADIPGKRHDDLDLARLSTAVTGRVLEPLAD